MTQRAETRHSGGHALLRVGEDTHAIRGPGLAILHVNAVSRSWMQLARPRRVKLDTMSPGLVRMFVISVAAVAARRVCAHKTRTLTTSATLSVGRNQHTF